MEEVKLPALATFDHHCHPGVYGFTRRKTYTCKVCKRMWTYEGKNAWHSEGGNVSEIYAVVMRDADGTFRVVM